MEALIPRLRSPQPLEKMNSTISRQSILKEQKDGSFRSSSRAANTPIISSETSDITSSREGSKAYNSQKSKLIITSHRGKIDIVMSAMGAESSNSNSFKTDSDYDKNAQDGTFGNKGK